MDSTSSYTQLGARTLFSVRLEYKSIVSKRLFDFAFMPGPEPTSSDPASLGFCNSMLTPSTPGLVSTIGTGTANYAVPNTCLCPIYAGSLCCAWGLPLSKWASSSPPGLTSSQLPSQTSWPSCKTECRPLHLTKLLPSLSLSWVLLCPSCSDPSRRSPLLLLA